MSQKIKNWIFYLASSFLLFFIVLKETLTRFLPFFTHTPEIHVLIHFLPIFTTGGYQEVILKSSLSWTVKLMIIIYTFYPKLTTTIQTIYSFLRIYPIYKLGHLTGTNTNQSYDKVHYDYRSLIVVFGGYKTSPSTTWHL